MRMSSKSIGNVIFKQKKLMNILILKALLMLTMILIKVLPNLNLKLKLHLITLKNIHKFLINLFNLFNI